MSEKKNAPCTVCEAMPSEYCWQRKPGAKGIRAQSMAGGVRLCDTCLSKARSMNAVAYEHPLSRTVLEAKTCEVLRRIIHNK